MGGKKGGGKKSNILRKPRGGVKRGKGEKERARGALRRKKRGNPTAENGGNKGGGGDFPQFPQE